MVFMIFTDCGNPVTGVLGGRNCRQNAEVVSVCTDVKLDDLLDVRMSRELAAESKYKFSKVR